MRLEASHFHDLWSDSQYHWRLISVAGIIWWDVLGHPNWGGLLILPSLNKQIHRKIGRPCASLSSDLWVLMQWIWHWQYHQLLLKLDRTLSYKTIKVITVNRIFVSLEGCKICVDWAIFIGQLPSATTNQKKQIATWFFSSCPLNCRKLDLLAGYIAAICLTKMAYSQRTNITSLPTRER